jgi:hypothetical protein
MNNAKVFAARDSTKRQGSSKSTLNRERGLSVYRKWVMTFALVVATAIPLVAEETPALSSTPTQGSPVSASFLSSGEGWIVSAAKCAKKDCARIEHTVNSGATWSTLRLPRGMQTSLQASIGGYYSVPQLSIYFSNPNDGWVYGLTQGKNEDASSAAVMWSTHDGGKQWIEVPTKSLGMKFNVLAIGASRGSVYAIAWKTVDTFGLWRSSTTTGTWRPVHTPTLYSAAGGTNMEGALVFKGTSGWLMIGNDRGVTGSAQLTSSGSWAKWNAACDKVGGGYDVPVAYSATSLVDVCSIGGFGEVVAPGTPRNLKVGTNWLFVSSNGGRTFVPVSHFGNENTTQWLDGVAGLPASPSPGVIFVVQTYQKGQSYVERLLTTRNDGKTWRVVFVPTSLAMDSIEYLAFASPHLGFGIVDNGTSKSILIVSTDGGRTWH